MGAESDMRLFLFSDDDAQQLASRDEVIAYPEPFVFRKRFLKNQRLPRFFYQLSAPDSDVTIHNEDSHRGPGGKFYFDLELLPRSFEIVRCIPTYSNQAVEFWYDTQEGLLAGQASTLNAIDFDQYALCLLPADLALLAIGLSDNKDELWERVARYRPELLVDATEQGDLTEQHFVKSTEFAGLSAYQDIWDTAAKAISAGYALSTAQAELQAADQLLKGKPFASKKLRQWCAVRQFLLAAQRDKDWGRFLNPDEKLRVSSRLFDALICDYLETESPLPNHPALIALSHSRIQLGLEFSQPSWVERIVVRQFKPGLQKLDELGLEGESQYRRVCAEYCMAAPLPETDFEPAVLQWQGNPPDI